MGDVQIVQLSAAGAYFVFVTNQFGFAQSSNAVLTVTGGINSGTAPVLTLQPTNQTVAVGGTATFNVDGSWWREPGFPIIKSSL